MRHKSVNTPLSHERLVVRTWLAVYIYISLKDLMYQEPIHDFHHLKQRIRQCCDAIQLDVLLHVHADWQKRLAVCLAQKGQHIRRTRVVRPNFPSFGHNNFSTRQRRWNGLHHFSSEIKLVLNDISHAPLPI